MTDNESDLRKWRLPRGRHGLPRELVARSQRERLLAAVVRVAAAKGYESTSVADILEEAGVGRESFYELFEDKKDCLLAARGDPRRRPRGDGRARLRGARALGRRVRTRWRRCSTGSPPIRRRREVIFVELAAVGPIRASSSRPTSPASRKLLDDGLEEANRYPACPRPPGSRSAPPSPGSTRRSFATAPPSCHGCCPNSPTRCSSPSSAKSRPAAEERHAEGARSRRARLGPAASGHAAARRGAGVEPPSATTVLGAGLGRGRKPKRELASPSVTARDSSAVGPGRSPSARWPLAPGPRRRSATLPPLDHDLDAGRTADAAGARLHFELTDAGHGSPAGRPAASRAGRRPRCRSG